MDRDEEVLVRSQVSSASCFATCPLRRRVQRSWTALAFRRRETPNQVVSRWLVETCQMDVKKDKTAMDGTPEPVNKRAQPTASEVFQRNTWKRDTWRRTEHSASSREANDDWDNKSSQDKSNVIINTDQKGSCLSPKQKISETRMRPTNRRSRPCGLDDLKQMCERSLCPVL